MEITFYLDKAFFVLSPSSILISFLVILLFITFYLYLEERSKRKKAETI